MKINESLTVVTSFNQRLFKNPHQQVVESMKRFNPDTPFCIYHENKYDMKHFGTEIDTSKLSESSMKIDLFNCWDDFDNLDNNWLEEFIDGDDSYFRKGKGMWNVNAKYWFRKIATWYHISKTCKTRYFLWLDSDIRFLRKIDSEFFDFIKEYDTCCIRRPLRQTGEHDGFRGSPPETGIVSFDLSNKNVVDFIDHIFYSFLNGNVFDDEPRWDDSWVYGKTLNTHYSDKLNCGIFKNKFVRPGEPFIDMSKTSSFDIYNDYFKHFKKNIDYRMLPEERKLLDED